MKFAAILFPVVLAGAQTFSITGPANARPGTTVPLFLHLDSTTGNSGFVAFQFSVTIPAGYTLATTNNMTNTSLFCVPQGTFCISVNPTAPTVISVGDLVSLSLTIPANAVSGDVSIPLSNIIAADAQGLNVPGIKLAPDFRIRVQPAPEDINGDGAITLADATAMVDEAKLSETGQGPCVHDLNGDGKCNVLDVVLVWVKLWQQAQLH